MRASPNAMDSAFLISVYQAKSSSFFPIPFKKSAVWHKQQIRLLVAVGSVAFRPRVSWQLSGREVPRTGYLATSFSLVHQSLSIVELVS